MEILPLGVGAAVGAGAGLIDRNARSLQPNHVQLIYRAGGLAASLWAQHQGWGPPNVAPAAVAGFAASLAGRATILLLVHDISNFGMASAQKLTNVTEAGMAGCPCGQVH